MNISKDEIMLLERVFSLLSVGLCHAIKCGAVDVDEAGGILYSPKMLWLLENMGASGSLVSLIHMGTELEDIESIIPDKFGAELDKMIEIGIKMLSESPCSNPQLDSWYDPIYKNRDI